MSERGKSGMADGQTPWRRWQMGELQTPRRAASTEAHGGAETKQDDDRRQAFRRRAELQALREKVRREAHEEGLEEGREQGHAEGLTKGLEEGRQQAKDEMEARLAEALAPLAPLTTAFSTALEQLDETIAEDLVDLALATGYQLAGEALKARPRQVLELVRTLLHTEPPLIGQQRLWLHPLDHKLVQKHLGEELEAAGWMLQPDDQLSRGGCRVTSANGELDATWESRWQAVKAQVRHRSPTTHQSQGDEH
ncbi:flagellar assembly protein FliH [Halomonas sp. LR5S13]|uniref:flagellar assembly protein FliH n=1 Tax=Halomonas rhizosphaerae TaxID=3043296 RepID=UPI0024A88780|nr:flagellar assembly protein FliH [Halomonas rhizosphaerae]MDI5922800.1 flagellar assembly protein FliH [Halomonas rhizosphaerae]